MDIKALKDKIILGDKKDVLRWHLYGKFLQYGIKPFENDLDIILELYQFGGYDSADTQKAFINNCLEKGMKKSAQSVRNTLSRYTNLKVLDKPRNRVLRLNADFLPEVPCDKLVIQHIISHKN